MRPLYIGFVEFMDMYYIFFWKLDIIFCKYYELVFVSFCLRVLIQDCPCSSKAFFYHLLILELKIIGVLP